MKHQIIKNNPPASLKRTIIESVAVALVVMVPLSVQAGFFEVFKATKVEGATNLEIVQNSQSPVDVEILTALQNPNPCARGGAEVVVNDGALVSSGPVGADTIAESKANSGEISVYTVRSGDTLSHIAEMYGVTANTILWANDLKRASDIREGQSLIILPIAGVQHTVIKGDTLASIAKKYDGKTEEILAYNQIEEGDGLVVGSTLVIPGGAIHTAPVTKSVSPTKTSGSNGATGSAWLSHPAPGTIKTQGLHGYNAVDFAAGVGTSIRAAAGGEVIVSKNSGWNGGYGQYIVIKHSNGAQTLYAHLSRNDVVVGDYVSQGELIGAMGNTGRSTGPHLHFEVRGAKNTF
jgi:LysM repeat protein